MGFDQSVVVYNACVLYPFHTRNILVQCGVGCLVRPRWTNAIHDEWIRNLVAASREIPVQRLYHVRDLMNRVLPCADVRDYENHIAKLQLPDPGDRHVLPAAITTGAAQIITWNIRYLPDEVLSEYSLRTRTPDHLLADLFDQIPDAVIATTAQTRRNLRRSLVPQAVFVEALSSQGLSRFASLMQGYLAEF